MGMPELHLSSRAKNNNVLTDLDLDLIKQIARENMAAFDEFCRRHHQGLYHFLLRTLQRPELVEEVLNATLFVVWQKAHTFRGDAKPSTWLYGIAYNKAMKAVSQLQRVPEYEAAELSEIMEAEADIPEQLSADRQTQEHIQRALCGLSPEHRAVVELTYFHGYTVTEIGSIIGCPANTVKTRMFHARSKLKHLLSRTFRQGV